VANPFPAAATIVTGEWRTSLSARRWRKGAQLSYRSLRMRASSTATPVRIGILGAARIAPMALIAPAQRVPEVTIAAVAARDPARARTFAAKHGIPKTHASYDELLADREIDAIYNPLPNSLHRPWTEKALAAGKHVLCEKPFTSNASEAEEVARAAARSDRVVMEAFHYRYHPLAERMREIVTGGTLGRIERIETWMCVPFLVPGDICYRLELAGGATMDVGSYAIHMLRLLAGAEPQVVRARARLSSPQVDRWMQAEVQLPDGSTGCATSSLCSLTLLRIGAYVRGTLGEMRVFNPVAPQFYHRLKVRTAAGTRVERLTREPTYYFQLRAFARAIQQGTPVLTPPSDSVANMRVIDAVYEKAGLRPRGS
jgi:predicted dehydrogenase